MTVLLLCDRNPVIQNSEVEFLVELLHCKNLGTIFLVLGVLLVLKKSPGVPLLRNHIDRSLHNDYHNFHNLSGNNVFSKPMF